MSVRPASVSDARDVARVQVSSWQSAYKEQLPDTYLRNLSVERHTEQWTRAMANSSTLVDVYDNEDQVVGFVAYGQERDEQNLYRRGEVYAIYVEANSWSKGCGKALLDSALYSLQNQGYGAVILWVLNTNQRAIQFYERNGFVPDGQSKIDRLAPGIMVTELRYVHSFIVNL